GRHCEEPLRRSNPFFLCWVRWIASLALAMTGGTSFLAARSCQASRSMRSEKYSTQKVPSKMLMWLAFVAASPHPGFFRGFPLHPVRYATCSVGVAIVKQRREGRDKLLLPDGWMGMTVDGGTLAIGDAGHAGATLT